MNLVFLLTAASGAGGQYYQTGFSRGQQLVHHGFGEECIVPKHFVGATYKPKDSIKEADLCQLDFYEKISSADVQVVGLCPKVESTNPAVELYSLPLGRSKDEFEKTECPKADDRRSGKKLGKFKQSVTCSYTPSILGYYQLSRILGGILDVPVSVIRTMDKDRHLDFVKNAASIVSKLFPVSDPIIEQAWNKTWPALHADPEGRTIGARAALVFSSDYKFIYGALVQNPKKESEYTELNGRTYETRYSDFKGKIQYKNLLNPDPVSHWLDGQSEQDRLVKSGPTVLQMRDLGDMIVMDQIMSQADRIGNVHFTYQYEILGPGKIEEVEAELVKDAKGKDVPDPAQAEQMNERSAVLVKKIMIRDNDCGVIKENNAKIHKLLEGVHHFNPETYRRLLWVGEQIQNAEPMIRAFFQEEALFTDKDWALFKANVQEVLGRLRSQCLAGSLHLDLDLDSYVFGRSPSDSRSLCNQL